MPESFDLFKKEVTEWLLDNVPQNARILDVGPGKGTYSQLLKPYGYRLDCVEIWQPYIDKYELSSQYDHVYNQDIMDFEGLALYDFIILGDVLEHIPTMQAQQLINSIIQKGIGCLVAVPYSMEQGEYDGNIYETHHQPDLTEDVMNYRYPSLTLIYGNQYYAYYTNKSWKYEKAYVLFTTESYSDLADICCQSIRAVSKHPILVYMANSDKQLASATETIRWDCDAKILVNRDDFIHRRDKNIYLLLKERPSIMLDALKRTEVAAYVDTDSIASKHADRMFAFYDPTEAYTHFTKGIYEFLMVDGKGGVENRDELHKSLEHNACDLFSIDQSTRKDYRQTGYFVCGQNTTGFLKEWYWMCLHPTILGNTFKYCPFHEETIVNVLLWKYDLTCGLPLVYVNGLHKDLTFNGQEQLLEDWVKIPTHEENLLFYHGEKDIKKLKKFLQYLRTF